MHPETILHRETNHSLRGLTVWLTGLPSAGKTTLARTVAQRLRAEGEAIELLDGDLIRSKISRDLGFSREHREENLRRICFVAELLTRNGITVVIAAISPYRALRRAIRNQLSPFIEVFVNAPLTVCEQRDVKGLYKRCRRGEITGLLVSTPSTSIRSRRMSNAAPISKQWKRVWKDLSGNSYPTRA